MEQKTLVAHQRPSTKKTENRRLRNEGMIPAVIYGHSEPVSISISAREFEKKFHSVSENTIINIDVEKNKKYDVLVKDYQEDMIKNRIVHIDFYEIERGKVLRTHVPVHLEGVPQGVREGGIVENQLHEVEIECLPKDIPESFTLDISAMQIGDARHVSDIPVGESVKILTPEDQSLVVITTMKVSLAETEEGEEEEGEAEGEEAAPAEGEGEE
ncbi:50S ribosomal protein L25 [Marispirochaeta sp.]|jgi:large subunit ribosomal protein L25|uniref:50S ribosomal protein L25 n=1 Tax=Marispirochaeta sp. TaxID=2038653 RepID=UPI0029C8B1BB|nr:50S ribosomal protein L25 [Marispirochaeta sp.]